MFDYSRAAGQLILEDLKKWCHRFKTFFSIFTLIYLSYCLIMDVGIFYVNATLLVLYVIYTVCEFIAFKKQNKKLKRVVSRGYKYARLALKTLTLGSTLYGIYIASTAVDGISLILATLTIILWVLQVLLEVVTVIVEPRVKLFVAGVMKDGKPLISAINLLSKETNWSFDYDKYEKEYELLEKRVERNKAAKKPTKKKSLKTLLTIGAKALDSSED